MAGLKFKKEWAEVLEWRDGISQMLGTSVYMGNPENEREFIHWRMIGPEEHDTLKGEPDPDELNHPNPRIRGDWDYRVQYWEPRGGTGDMMCSVYSLYNELRYAYNLIHSDQIPPLYSVSGFREKYGLDHLTGAQWEREYKKMMIANRPRNLRLMKDHLRKLTTFSPWPVVPEWGLKYRSQNAMKIEYLKQLKIMKFD